MILLEPNGEFQADLIFTRAGVVCAALGTGSPAGVQGQYACARSGMLLDQGTLILAPR